MELFMFTALGLLFILYMLIAAGDPRKDGQ